MTADMDLPAPLGEDFHQEVCLEVTVSLGTKWNKS